MKTLLLILLCSVSTFIFSQNKEIHESKVTFESLKKASSIKELLTDFPSNYNVLSAEFSFPMKGKSHQEQSNGNNIPKALKESALKKGEIIYIDMKLKEDEKKVKDPRIMTFSAKLIII
jgi:hypothetical protein